MIFAMPTAVMLDPASFEGIESIIERNISEKYGNDTSIAVVAGGARGASRNVIIARAQANRRRDPFYINRESMDSIKGIVPAVYSALGSARRAADSIGGMLIDSIARNVQAQSNQDGSGFTDLTAGYARRKARKFGFVKPILRATGDLLGGLRVRVTMGGGV